MLDLTFGPSLKVKRWFTGFGELSCRGTQICIGEPMRRSHFDWYNGTWFKKISQITL